MIPSNITSTVITVCVSYWINQHFVFQAKVFPGPRSFLLRIDAIYGMVLQSAIIWVIVHGLPHSAWGSRCPIAETCRKIVAMGTGAVCNYLGYRFILPQEVDILPSNTSTQRCWRSRNAYPIIKVSAVALIGLLSLSLTSCRIGSGNQTAQSSPRPRQAGMKRRGVHKARLPKVLLPRPRRKCHGERPRRGVTPTLGIIPQGASRLEDRGCERNLVNSPLETSTAGSLTIFYNCAWLILSRG